MTPAEARATATTYALLGLLAVRPWTGYELTAQARRSLHAVWPRSEANLYNEQKRLVALGWARADEDAVGRRPRTTYSITAAGRRALRAWLATEPAPPRVEVEGLLRIMYADQAGPDELRASLEATAAQARAEMQRGLALLQEYASGDGPFPERAHLVALIGDFLTDLFGLIEDHATRTAALVERWADTADPAAGGETDTVLAGILARHEHRLDRPSG